MPVPPNTPSPLLACINEGLNPDWDGTFGGIAFCGCCGIELANPEADWCFACSLHVLKTGMPHERTYLAQYGVECPNVPPDPGGEPMKAAA